MGIRIREASVKDAPLIAATRRIVWEQTYRGIYSDEKLDHYDMEYYTQRDADYISSPGHYYYLFQKGEECVGYFSYGPGNYGTYKDFSLCLNNLYILEDCKGRGLGKLAFQYIRTYAYRQGINKFYCGCNAHNYPAQGFYRHMGGSVGNISVGHKDRSDDIIHFEFTIGDKL